MIQKATYSHAYVDSLSIVAITFRVRVRSWLKHAKNILELRSQPPSYTTVLLTEV